jgi:hypothetical protein
MAIREIVKTGTYGMVRSGQPTSPIETAKLVQTAPSSGSIILNNSEAVSVEQWESLSPAEQAYLQKFGVNAFNKEQATVSEQRAKRIEPYKVGEGYDVVAMTQAGHTPGALQTLGFSEAGIREAQEIVNAQDRPGEEVFAELQGKGDIPKEAIYKSYDKTTGEVTFTTPDTRSGAEIFGDMQLSGQIVQNATYKGYDKATNIVSYEVPDTRTGQEIFRDMQSSGSIPNNATYVGFNAATRQLRYQEAKTEVVATVHAEDNTTLNTVLAGAAAVAVGTGQGLLTIPTPPTWAAAAIVLAIAGAVTWVVTGRIMDRNAPSERTPGSVTTMSDVVVTTGSGAMPFTLQNLTRGGQTLTTPLETEGIVDYRTLLENIKPLDLRLILEQEHFYQEGIPLQNEPRTVIIRDPLTSDPLGQGKLQNVLTAALATQQATTHLQRTITKEMPMTRQQWEVLQEALRQGRVAEGKRIIEGLANKAGTPEIARSYRLAYEDYLRKKAILDAARKSYVASLNPQPIKGVGSNEATAAAVGVWFVSDILRDRLAKALKRGDSVKTALGKIQPTIKEAAKAMGLTQHQIKIGTATVIYEAMLQSMIAEAIKAASQAQVQGQTQTQVRTAAQTAAQTAIQTIASEAVQSKAITRTQARELTRTLEQTATDITEVIATIRLPLLSGTSKKKKDAWEYPDGTIVWKMGELKRGGEWKIIPPPYNLKKAISSTKPPKGVTRLTGTPQETLTFIGGKLPFKNVSFDLGIVDGYIDVKTKKIVFTGHGLETNVGTRIAGATKGISIPATQARFEALTPKQLAASAAWKQGIVFCMVHPPYGEDNILYSHKPFPGVKTLEGAESAYKTLVKLGARLPSSIKRSMGIMDVTITTGKQGMGIPAISFKHIIQRPKSRQFVPRRPKSRHLAKTVSIGR